MNGLDCFGCDDTTVGFDWMSLAKGASGMLQGAGGLMSGTKPASTTDAERLKLEMDKLKAEQTATALKWALGAVGAAGVAVLVALLVRK